MAGWTGRHYYSGKNKEAFDAELYALYQATKAPDGRSETDQDYAILPDSTAAIERARSNAAGSEQRFAAAIIEVGGRLISRGDTLTTRCVSSHVGIEGNEISDEWAKNEADSLGRRGKSYQWRRRSGGIKWWVTDHTDRRR